MPQFTLHSLDMTVEVMRTSACAALLPARYAERFAHLDVMDHIPEQSLPVWACYHYTQNRSDHQRCAGLDRAELSQITMVKVRQIFRGYSAQMVLTRRPDPSPFQLSLGPYIDAHVAERCRATKRVLYLCTLWPIHQWHLAHLNIASRKQAA